MTFGTLFVVAVVSGLLTSVITLTYQLGDGRRIYPCHIALFMGAAGIIVFAMQAAAISTPSASEAPPVIWLLGLGAGVAQGLTIYLIRLSFARGPYSPVLCSLRLMFAVVALFSIIFLSETLTIQQYGGLAAAVACVFASVYTKTDRAILNRVSERSALDKLVFMGLLAGILLTQGVTGITMKYLGSLPLDATRNLYSHFDSIYLLMLYVGFTGTVLVESLRAGRPPGKLSALFALGGIAAFGSVGAMKGISIASVMPAGIGFVVSGITGIVVSGVISTFFFGDRRNGAWYLTIILAVIAALLMNPQTNG